MTEDGVVLLGKTKYLASVSDPYAHGAAVFCSARGAAWECRAPLDYDSIEMKDLS